MDGSGWRGGGGQEGKGEGVLGHSEWVEKTLNSGFYIFMEDLGFNSSSEFPSRSSLSISLVPSVCNDLVISGYLFVLYA